MWCALLFHFSVTTTHTSIAAGSVFMGVHTVAGKEVAIKIEPAISRNSLSPLKQESKIYKTLMGGPGVPWIMWSGRQGDFNVMVIDLLGPSLEDLFKMCNRHFTLKTVLLLTDQLVSPVAAHYPPCRGAFRSASDVTPHSPCSHACRCADEVYCVQLERIEFIHTRDYVHRDVKPANFVMGTEEAANLVNVIDFGLAKKFRDTRTSDHIAYKQDEHHGVGTSLFAAINTHLGVGAYSLVMCIPETVADGHDRMLTPGRP